MIGSQKQTCCPNCGIGHCDGPPWDVIVFCPLHAAAPELLTACKAVLSDVSLDVYRVAAADRGRMTPAEAAFALLRAAIAKATSPQAQ